MSLPIHLQSIKSSGVYRFVFDKSVVNNQLAAETLRLLVGYSDKGPFNTPVYITSRDEFIRTYGNISKRLEKKGIYFHRLALQALAGGPILCLNLKNFTDSNVLQYVKFDASGIYSLGATSGLTKKVTEVYDTNRFWTVKAEDQVDDDPDNGKYIVLTTTDSKDAACSIIMRKAVPAEYALAIRDYYNGTGDEMPAYLNPIADKMLNDYFMDVYVFKGQFTEALCSGNGPLAAYFDVTSAGITLKEDYKDTYGDDADALVALANDVNSGYIAGYRGTTIPFFKGPNGNYISLDILFNSGYADHKMLMNMDESKLDEKDATALDNYLKAPYVDSTESDMNNNTVAYYHLTSSGDPVVYSYEDVTNTISAANKKKADKNRVASVPTTDITADSPEFISVLTATAPNITPLYLVGFDYSGNPVSAAESLGVITGDYGKGLREALTNRIDVEYHYLVDTFDTAVTNDKDILSTLAKDKDNCFAILNFPKVKEFQKDPTNMPHNTLDFREVVKKFVMPDAASGDSWCGFFTQVVLTDGTIRTTVPSAGLVSNLFMDKWTSRQPYYIVAGSQYGRLQDGQLVGPDYAFSKTDRDVLEPYGINVIVYEPRRGTYINSEQTGKQIPVSALSKIHIRELVIYLQDEIAELLESYRWELNTQVLRDKIKARADVILSTVQNNGGVYDYLNVCDESNNTPETIDNEFLVLDTHIEPARGMGKCVEQLYIYRTGEMRSVLLQG